MAIRREGVLAVEEHSTKPKWLNKYCLTFPIFSDANNRQDDKFFVKHFLVNLVKNGIELDKYNSTMFQYTGKLARNKIRFRLNINNDNIVMNIVEIPYDDDHKIAGILVDLYTEVERVLRNVETVCNICDELFESEE